MKKTWTQFLMGLTFASCGQLPRMSEPQPVPPYNQPQKTQSQDGQPLQTSQEPVETIKQGRSDPVDTTQGAIAS